MVGNNRNADTNVVNVNEQRRKNLGVNRRGDGLSTD
jgi:hypothetical protein